MQQTLFLLIRQRYDLFICKWATSCENLFLSYVNKKSADQPAHPCSLISGCVVRCWIVTRFYSSKLYSLIGTYTVSTTCQFAESLFRYMYICLSLSFTLQERSYNDSVSLCRLLVVNLFYQKKKRFCDFWDTELWVDIEIKVYSDALKKDISFWIYVKIRYENFHCSVIVDSMKERKLRKLQRVVHVLCALCAPGFKKGRKSMEA